LSLYFLLRGINLRKFYDVLNKDLQKRLRKRFRVENFYNIRYFRVKNSDSKKIKLSLFTNY
jgi:hypothetical protein